MNHKLALGKKCKIIEKLFSFFRYYCESQSDYVVNGKELGEKSSN